jgi:short-subunit dehydrogenase
MHFIEFQMIQYASRGVKLVLVARRQKELDAVATTCKAAGASDVLAIRADFSNGTEMDTVFRATIAKFGR